MRRQAAFVAMAGLLWGVGCVSGEEPADAGCPVSDGAVVVLDGSHVIVFMQGSLCQHHCAPGWDTCEGGPMCGTELNSELNCGTCGHICREGGRCRTNSVGRLGCYCSPPYDRNDACGVCGNICQPGEHCALREVNGYGCVPN